MNQYKFIFILIVVSFLLLIWIPLVYVIIFSGLLFYYRRQILSFTDYVMAYKYVEQIPTTTVNMNDTDAINESNFMFYSHEKRDQFFKGNYFNKEEDKMFRTRKLNSIIPVYIEYFTNNQLSKRKVEIFGIKTFEGSCYLYGFCHQRGEGRTFSIGKIIRLIDKDGDAFYTKDIPEYIRNHLLQFVDNDYNRKVIANCLP